jgi:diguanylate cyclase (GGDEF)-like protein
MASFRNMVSRAAQRLSFVSDAQIDDDLLRHLVFTLCGSIQSLYVSIVMGAIIAFCAWAMSGETVFLVFVGLHVLLGVYRVDLAWGMQKASKGSVPRREIISLDRRFLVSSTLFALLVGMANYCMLATPPSVGLAALALAVTCAYSVAFVTRSSGRLKLLGAQALAMVAPPMVGYATLPLPNGAVYVALLAVLVASIMIMGLATNAQVVALYRADQNMRRMARTDMLTGLLNRFAFAEAVDTALRRNPGDSAFGILAVDIDRFKEFNDSLGHDAGDEVIAEAGRRLRRVVGPGDIVARLGGDEFVILSTAGGGRQRAVFDLARRIVGEMAHPYSLGGTSLPSSASVGFALYPAHGDTSADLMKNADIALYEAKRNGRNTACLFDRSLAERITMTRALELEMHVGLADDVFTPWFQPIYNLASGEVESQEALARWRHPVRGFVPPDRFIPLAEQNGSIHAIGARILEKACAEAASWPSHINLAVNLSPVQFRDAARLAATVRAILDRSGFDPHRLELEITESILMSDSPDTRAAIDELARAGVRFSLDDFGAGYSSLSYIRDYPFSKIKIDKRFVDGVDSDATSSAIISAVCAMSLRLGISVVAEGVETRAQEEALRKLGVVRAQGYLYGRPIAGPLVPKEWLAASA